MGIRLNSNEVSSVKLNATSVSEVKLNGTKVFPNTPVYTWQYIGAAPQFSMCEDPGYNMIGTSCPVHLEEIYVVGNSIGMGTSDCQILRCV